jgi:hypothetical protein
LTDGLDRTLVEPGAEAATDRYVADIAVAVDHDFKNHVPGGASAACVVGVLRFHLTQQARRFDTASGSIRPAAGAAPHARTDSGSQAFTVARAAAGASATAGTAPQANAFIASLQCAVALIGVRRWRHGRNEPS